mmetsp:Transcript_13395/g.28975  ORF Transcript_13395/g.28975 Transcript_13395/m.28975 type:complete len:529 (-) Transcript_13395:26-1612(-)
MAARDMIDLAVSSSDDEEGVSSPEFLSPMPAQSSRTCQRFQNRKRAASGIASEEVVKVSSSPSLSPARMATKTRKEEKREALKRAREWRDNRKRGTPGLGTNNNAAARSREVVNLSSPSSHSPVRNSGRRASHVAIPRTPTPRKISKTEKQEALARARQWHENRQSCNHSRDEHTADEVVNLSSPPFENLPESYTRQREFHPSSRAPSSSVATARMGETQHISETSPLFAGEIPFAAGSRGMRELEDEEKTQQWACPICTLLNPQHQSRCGACFHEIAVQQSNLGGVAGEPAYDVGSDGGFVLGEQNDQRSTQMPSSGHNFGSALRVSAAGPAHGHVQVGGRSSAMLSALGGGSMSEFLAREVPQQLHATSGGGGWGRSRAFESTLFGGGLNHHPMAGYNGSRNSTPLLQLLSSMRARHGNAFRQSHLDENTDSMSYERLLQVFGDGSENRGASPGDIASLPVSKIGDPKVELPDDKRQCSICLEDFCRGEERTTLPCLHGFHSGCVNRWLSSNGSCPVCKTSISNSR